VETAYPNPYRELLREARRVRKQRLRHATAGEQEAIQAAWEPILAFLVNAQKHLTRTNQKAKERFAGPILALEETRRISDLKAWFAGGCRLEDWSRIVSRELTPRAPEQGGWVNETTRTTRTTIVTADLRSAQNAV
jgi:hypothetical protein